MASAAAVMKSLPVSGLKPAMANSRPMLSDGCAGSFARYVSFMSSHRVIVEFMNAASGSVSLSFEPKISPPSGYDTLRRAK